MRLIQLKHPELGRRVAVVDEPYLFLIDQKFKSCYALFEEIIENNHSSEKFINGVITDQKIDYDSVYNGSDKWRILPAFDHPDNPLGCILSGTGLTHKASADNRQQMHKKLADNGDLTDSMEMYLWGEENGKPESDKIGVQPEWFFKGNGSALRGLNAPLEVPPYADDGGEEPEIAGLYYISKNGRPFRVGFAIANEFSDHVMEKKNYLYLAPSKLRSPAIGPELVLGSDFKNIAGRVCVNRDGREIWAKKIKTGQENMAHSLANLEYHHFKYEQHRLPGMVHIHFFGADAFSFGQGITLQDGDCMCVSFDGFGRSLQNPIKISREKESQITIHTMD